jgi:hypothetical protein
MPAPGEGYISVFSLLNILNIFLMSDKESASLVFPICHPNKKNQRAIVVLLYKNSQ